MQPFFEAVDRYEGIRDAIFEFAQTALLTRIENDPRLASLREASFCIGPIDGEALAASWSPSEFPWADLH